MDLEAENFRQFLNASKNTRMKSQTRGMNTSEPEVIRISKEEIWLSFQGRELCLPFEHFPWFKDAAAAAIKNVHSIHQDHLHWPDLDVDLSLESIEGPYRFPLVAN
jgi:hypothetical protein